MLHLSAERLAALQDEPPTAEELAHLAGCAECAGERRAYGALRTLAEGEHARLGTPLTDWNALAPRLRADGVIDTGAPIAARRRLPVRWLQVAAGLLLVAGGAMLGRVSAHQGPIPAAAPTLDTAPKTVASAATDTVFESAQRAQQVRDSAAVLYQQAVAFLARQDSATTSATPASIRSRLAALDHVSETMRQALQLAPGDPVINGYYLTTLGQREATIRQLNTALPAGLRMQSY